MVVVTEIIFGWFYEGSVSGSVGSAGVVSAFSGLGSGSEALLSESHLPRVPSWSGVRLSPRKSQMIFLTRQPGSFWMLTALPGLDGGLLRCAGLLDEFCDVGDSLDDGLDDVPCCEGRGADGICAALVCAIAVDGGCYLFDDEVCREVVDVSEHNL